MRSPLGNGPRPLGGVLVPIPMSGKGLVLANWEH
jgi:hypothetical protein